METRSNHVLVGTIVLALLVGVLLFTVWLAGLSAKTNNCFDIYFSQGVGGLSKGTQVNYAGVPVGEVEKISLLPNRPEFVWVRVEVDSEAPILQGTTAQIKGVGFTGVSEISLDGAVKDGKPIAIIVGWSFADNENTDAAGRPQSARLLVVMRLPPGPVCKVAYIDRAANSDAQELARKAADEAARNFKCGTDKVQVIGKRGRAIEAMSPDPDGEQAMPKP